MSSYCGMTPEREIQAVEQIKEKFDTKSKEQGRWLKQELHPFRLRLDMLENQGDVRQTALEQRINLLEAKCNELQQIVSALEGRG